MLQQLFFQVHDIVDLVQEPAVYKGGLVDGSLPTSPSINASLMRKMRSQVGRFQLFDQLFALHE